MKYEDKGYTYQILPSRGLTADTCRFYGMRTKVDTDGQPREIEYPYGEAAKIRNLIEKKFYTKGEIANAGLFGKDKFPAGMARAITITEGEHDAASVFQMLGSRYPAVSVQSSSSARRDCIKDREYLNSFDKIYLCLDNDEPGKRASKEIAQLFDFNKVYHVQLSDFKDANDYLQSDKADTFRNVWHNARRFMPEGIVSSYGEIRSILEGAKDKPSLPIPFPTLQEMLGGLRTSESVLFTALEGTGKTEIIRALEYSILKNSDVPIGVIHLEEPKDRLIKGLAGLEMNLPAHIKELGISNDDILKAYKAATGRDDRLHIYSHFGSDDPNVILDTIRFLVTSAGCRYIFLDHITMVVSGLGGDDERTALDYLSTRLEIMVKELDFGLIFISHVNDEGKTRGSRNISKVCDVWVHLDRDIRNESEYIRNQTHLTVLKNRPRSRSGPAGTLLFNPETFTLREMTKELPV